MKFYEFINKVHSNSHKPNQGQYILEAFSALCGENDPFVANKYSPYSKTLPEGLASKDDSYRKRLFNGELKQYRGLSGPIKKHIREHKNKDTFIAYLEKTVSNVAFPKLCTDFEVSEIVDRAVMFKSIYEQFLSFAFSSKDEVEYTVPETVIKLSGAKEETTESDLSQPESELPQDKIESENENKEVPPIGTPSEEMNIKFEQLIKEYRIAHFMCSELTYSQRIDKFVEAVQSELLAEFVSYQEESMFTSISEFNKTLYGFNTSLEDVSPIYERTLRLNITFLRTLHLPLFEITANITEDIDRLVKKREALLEEYTQPKPELEDEIRHLSMVKSLLAMYSRINTLYSKICNGKTLLVY